MGCGACCIAASIIEPFYGMPQGKPANVRCVHLDENKLCRLFGDERRPKCCVNFKAEVFCCGDSFESAMTRLAELEFITIRNK